MTWFLTLILIGLGAIFMVSLVRWNLSRALRKSLTPSDNEVYHNKRVSATAKLKTGETYGIPLKCSITLGQREIHIIPNRFSPLLFMTDFPYTFSKSSNKKLKIKRSDSSEIIFTGRQRKSSVFGREVEITIGIFDPDEKKEFLRKLKNWK